jgi:hypothetical protein
MKPRSVALKAVPAASLPASLIVFASDSDAVSWQTNLAENPVADLASALT